MTYLLRDVRRDDPQDAERLAEMFNDWDSAWPGGFTRGVPMTRDIMMDQLQRMQRLAMLVVESGDEFAGYCDLDAQVGQKEMAYIPLLGARLAHHGRGVGKTLLREMVRRVTDFGYRELTLETWAGNLKAVPLYKKTGFNWEPETNVFMRNYLPTALSIPAGKAFFAGRDWYECLDREIAVSPDEVKWNGMKVYPYRFRDGDDYLYLIFDGASGGLTSLETPEYAVSCSISAEETPAGETFPVTWELRAKGSRPIEVVLLAEGEPGLDLRVQERLTLRGEATVTRELRIEPDAKPRRGGQIPHRVKSTLLIDGEPVSLETGAKVVLPVEIQYGGQGLRAGREEKIEIRLRSRLDRPLEGSLALDPHPGIACDAPAQAFSLPAKSWTKCDFRLTAKEAGSFETRLRLTAGETRQDRSANFRAFGGDEARISIDPEDDEYAVLEKLGTRLHVNLRGGGFDLNGPARGYIGQSLAEIGPPFKEHRMRPALYESRRDSGLDGEALTLVAPSKEFPGLTLERSIRVLCDDLAKVDYRVKNVTDRAMPVRLRISHHPHFGGHLILPIPDGLIREPSRGWSGYPNGESDALAYGAAFTESWAASEDETEQQACGVIWTGDPEAKMDWGFPALTYDMGEIPAHSTRALPPIYLVGGGGDWKTVRRWWRRLVQPSGVHEDYDPEPVRVLEAKTDPSPVLLTKDRETAKVELLNRRGGELSGKLTVSGDALESPATFDLEKVNRDRPFAATVELRAGSLKAGNLLAEVDSGPETDSFRLPVIRIGGEGETRVSESDGLISADNGALRFAVAPGFLGSMVSLERDGTNHLLSAYPKERTFTWFNPWFGGIHPFLHWMADDALAKEKFAGEPVERIGERGFHWRGVKVSCQPEHKDRRWIALEAEYLTLPGSDLVALVNRWTNRSDARMHLNGGMAVWCQVGGTRENATLRWIRETEPRTRRRGGFETNAEAKRWIATSDGEAGDVLLAVATDPRGRAEAMNSREEGPHLSLTGDYSIGPNETVEILSWLVLTDSPERIEAYAALEKVRRLP